MAVQEESVTGDVYPESGTKRRSAASSSASILSPQITSQASHSASKRRNIWENTLDVRPPQDDSEGRRYWEYRNVYHIPVPPGIEYWEDEDRKRWEMTNIGGLNESEANRQIKAARAQELARTRQMIQPITPQATHITFTLSLICFGLQISLAMIALILSIYQIIYHSQLHSGLVFLLLALIPLTGGACGIFSTMMKSQTFTLTTAIYDVASAVGVAVAAINVYSFKIDEQKPLVGFLPLAFAIALVQLASFGIVLIIYIDMLTSEARRGSKRWHQQRTRPREPTREEYELTTRAQDITRKYKQYLQRKKQATEQSGKETEGEEFEQQMPGPSGLQELNL